MINGIVKIEVFLSLDEIAERRIGKGYLGKWGKAAWGKKKDQSRISELKAQARGDKERGRPYTFKKHVALIRGLIKMIGKQAMAKEILRLVKKSSDIDERLILYVLAMPDEDKISTEMYLKAVVEKASKS